MKNLILCFCISFYCIGNLSAQSDSIILALKDTLKVQVDSLDIANTLFDMGERYESLRDYKQALEKYEKALRIRIDSLGEDHLDVADTYHNFARVRGDLRNHKIALDLNMKALNIREGQLGNNHHQVARSHNNIGSTYDKLGEYNQAIVSYKKALNIWKEAFGEDHLRVAFVYRNLGNTYKHLGNYEKALEFHIKALKIKRNKLEEAHHDLASSYNDAGIIYLEIGNYEKALEFFNKALNIWENASEANYAVKSVIAYTNIGLVYYELGNYNQALKFLDKVLGKGDVLGNNHLIKALLPYNISKAHFRLGNYTEAIEWSEKALKIAIEQFGERHRRVANCYNLKSMILEQRDYEEAIKFNKKALDILKDKLGENHPDLSHSYHNLALIHNKLKKYEKALELSNKALKIRIDKLGTNHPSVAKSHANIANTHQALNNHQTADSIWHIVINQSLNRLNNTYLFLPDNQRLKYAKTFQEVYNIFYSYAAKHGSEDTKKLAAYLLLNTKSLALDYSVSVRELINNMDNEEVKTLHNELNTLNRNISQAEFMTTEERKEKDLDITVMRDQQESLSRQLLKNETLREKLYKTPVTWQATKDKLKPNEVILDFVRFYEEGDSTWMYYAMLTRKNMSAPEFIRITDQKAITGLLQANNTDGQPNYIQDEEGLKTLYQKIWQPLMPHLNGIKTVHLSPSGLLHRIDFEVLQDENDKYLAEYFEFHYYTTIRDFTEKKHTNFLSKIFKRNQYKNAVLLGDINYKLSSEKEREDTVDLVFRDEINPLPATREEIDAISNIIENRRGLSTRISGSDATENAIQNCTGDKSSHIFHYATHGKYLQALDSLGKQTALQNRLSATGNPLQRSMLLLSGGGDTWTSKEYISRSDKDGILTAYEVTHLDLSNTKLVVLSACNTGLGDIHDTEGVLGLQSAFKLAGVEHVVVSLWKVNDAATKELMIAFYKNLLNKKQDAPTALRKAKAEMRDKGATPDKWAGFILIE